MREKRISRGISFSLWLPILMIGFLVIIALLLLDRWTKLAYGVCAMGVIYLVLSIIYYEYLTRMVNNELYEAGFHQSQLYKSMLKEMPVPYVLTTAAGSIVWYNDLFEQMCHGRVNKRNITQIFPLLHKKNFPQPEMDKVLELEHGDRRYQVHCQCVQAIETDESMIDLEEKTADEYVQVFYFYDVTEMMEYKDMSEKKRLVTGLMYIDNYEEVLENMEDVRQTLLLALVERKIVRYLQPMDAIVKRFEKDKFIFVFQEKNLDQMLEERFSILDEVRSINAGNEMSLTLSIGVGMNAPTYIGTYESARIAMDMALGRGGDQAVVKNGNSISYYGGRSQKVEKNTRVKARVKAHALREIILSHDNILIMGHKNPDADCIGAAIGVYRMAKTFGKKAY
ncbi:MAG: DHH family phosphoesterase, partial [Eubacterium sp.]|nr:DHH family phosphoesterase [Eubacterium sp.]